MKKVVFVAVVVLVLGGGVWVYRLFGDKGQESKTLLVAEKEVEVGVMVKITSSRFENAGTIPQKYTCDGEDASPPLAVDGVPEKARSLALIVDDPDAPVGIWNHWLVWNIAPDTKQIVEDSVPQGAVLGTNDFGKTEYGGPCPPSGTHRYFFRLYVLDVKLDLAEGARREELERAMQGHILDQGELMGKYSR